MLDQDANPYVGPRTFTQQESDRFFGREREARDLLSLVISRRLVLFYAQSGAGKSSLINTRLIPQLLAEGFVVLPVGRVSGELPAGVSSVANIFVFNLMLGLDQSQGDPGRFAGLTLTDFLARLTTLDGRHYYYDETAEPGETAQAPPNTPPHILIMDQFEEIITAHPERWTDRADFFRQINQAMTKDPLLWLMLTLREDYVAALDPYADLLPGKMQARFYMQRMNYEAALEAVKKPAEQYGRPFASGVAEALADNLRQIRVTGQMDSRPGQFVEPVQLQVVCYQLWENLKNRPPSQITHQNLQELGDVDMALAQFYEQVITEAIQQTGVSEVELRNWFEQELITEGLTRGMVYRGAGQTGGLANRTVDLLVSRFLLRAEVKTGGTWYELIHDRFVSPIRQANQAWRLQQPLLQIAQAWAETGRSETKLLEGQPLQEALATNWSGLGPSVEEFLVASQAAQQAKEKALREEREQQRQRELATAQQLIEEQRRRVVVVRRALLGLAILLLLVLAVAGYAMVQQEEAFKNANLAATQAAEARAYADLAATREVQALVAQEGALKNASLAATQAAEARVYADLAATREAQALTAQDAAEARQALALTAVVVADEALTHWGDNLRTREAEAEHFHEETPGTPGPLPPPPPPEVDIDAPIATFDAVKAQLGIVKETQVAAADVSPCFIEPEGEFHALWDRYKERLGCPVQPRPSSSFFIEQPFERGFLFWSQTPDQFIVTIGRPEQGTWERIERSEVTWSENPAGDSCEVETPPGRPPQPTGTFSGLWCAREDIRQAIGFARAPERGVEHLFQEFDKGLLLRDSHNAVYILFAEDGTYRGRGG